MDSKDRPAVWAERKSNDNGNSESRRTENRSEEHTSELQSQSNLVCRLLLEKKNIRTLLESNGWLNVNTTTSAKDGTRPGYEEAGNALQVRVYEVFWSTYLAVGVSQTLPQAM